MSGREGGAHSGETRGHPPDPAGLVAALVSPWPDLLSSLLRLVIEATGADAAVATAPDMKTVGATGRSDAATATAGEADELQRRSFEGPTMTAVREGTAATAENLAADDRWPIWQPQAMAMGIRSVAAYPVPTTTDNGCLTLYSVTAGHLSAGGTHGAELFIDHLAAVMDTVGREAQLQRALDTRTVIGQAVGILIERYRITPDAAFAVLRRYSQDRNVKLKALARQLVSQGQLPGLGR